MTFPSLHRDILPANISVKDEVAHANILLNAFRVTVNHGLSVLNMVDGVVDEFEDETGVTTKTGATYDASGDYYQNTPGGYTADQIPTMTGYTSPSGTVTTSKDNTAAYAAWRALDDDNSTMWNTSGAPPAWVAYEFTSPKTIAKYTIRARDAQGHVAPVTFTFDGWNGGSYDQLDSVAGISWSAGEQKTFYVDNPAEYSKYRLYVIATTIGDVEVAEIEMMEAVAPSDMTLISDPFTAEAEPDEAFIVIWEEDVSAVTLNTDILAYVSIDNGSTWDQATLTEVATVENGRILTGTADVSARTGTTMVWKITTHNNKELKVHAVGLEWS
jgi:hypothetical protein